MSTSKSTILSRRRSLGGKKSPKPTRTCPKFGSNHDLSPDSDFSKSNTSIADDSSDISREDIEREKKNLNLDNFIRKLSIPDSMEINLLDLDQSSLKKERRNKSKAKSTRRLSLAVPNERRPSIIISDADKEPLSKSQDIATQACEYLSKTVQTPGCLKDVVQHEINREEGLFDQILSRSQVVTAFGRRLFDEDELKESSSDDTEDNDSTDELSKSRNDDEDKRKKKKRNKKKAQKVVVQSRYMQMFQKEEVSERKKNEDEIKAEEALAKIQENPTYFGVWDSVLDPANAKVRVENAYKRSEQQQMDEEIRKKEVEELRKHDDSGDHESNNDKDVDREKVVPFRTFVATGKYLHENDIKWCKKNTKFSEKEIIKWFRRFRTMCPRGDMTIDHLVATYNKLFVGGGNPDFFSELIFEQFDVNHKHSLDFKVYLFIVQVGSFTSTSERLSWIFQLLDLDGAGFLVIASIMEKAVRMYEAVEREQRPDDDYDKTFDLSLEETAEDLQLRSLEERMERILDFVNGDTKLNISKVNFEAIPTRIISASSF